MTQLSQATARTIQPGQELRCHVVKGLSLRGKPSGAAWYLLYVSPKTGDRRRPKLGNFPAITVENARAAARAYLQRVAAGDDPSGEKQALRSAPTVADLHAWFMVHHSKVRKAAKSQHYDQWYFDRFLAAGFGRLRVAEVTAADVNDVLSKIAEATSGTTANRVRSLLQIMFDYAEGDALKMRPKRSNPITKRDVPRRPEFSRRRYLTDDERDRVKAPMLAAMETHPRHVAAMWCILYAGSRVTELVTAKWEHVEGLAIVRRDHKSARTGRYRTIRLPRQAWELIARLPRHPGGWIFGEDVTVWSVGRVWRKIRDEAGLPDVQVKDFRRTFATMVRSSGGGISDVGDLLGHSNPTVTKRHYAFLFDDAATARVQAAGDVLDGLAPAQGAAVAALEDKGR